MDTHGFASALWAAIFPDSCCIYLFELLRAGISHAAVTGKPQHLVTTLPIPGKTQIP